MRKSATTLILIMPFLTMAQPACPSNPVPLDTYQWVLILAGAIFGGYILYKKKKETT